MAEFTKLTQKEVNSACTRWWFTSHTTYNYQRLMSGGVNCAFAPVQAKWYANDKDKLIEALQRNMMFFNTEPRWGAVILGVALALEEQYAEDPESIDPEIITDIKTSMMGPFAGIGDTLTQSLLQPLILSIALSFGQQGALFAPFIYIVPMVLFDWFCTHITWRKGYELGLNSIDSFMSKETVEKLTSALSILALYVVGAMIIRFVTVQPVFVIEFEGGGILDFKTTLDGLLPNVVPLLFTILAWRLQVRGMSVIKVFFVLFIVAFVFGVIGFLG